jgi:hypothetical protein
MGAEPALLLIPASGFDHTGGMLAREWSRGGSGKLSCLIISGN